jgi:predicted enzyme related to lactoylglutathione lyase
VDDAVKTIEDGGGSVMVAPMDVPGGGRILVAMDPQGAAFALFTGRIDD